MSLKLIRPNFLANTKKKVHFIYTTYLGTLECEVTQLVDASIDDISSTVMFSTY